jgi:hypothetical protein
MLFFQSGVSVPITAAAPSGEMRASVIAVEFKYSSKLIGGFADCAEERAVRRQTGRTRAIEKSRVRIH